MSKKVKITPRPARHQQSADTWVESRLQSKTPLQRGGIKRLTFDLDKETHSRLKLRCVHQETTIADLIRNLIAKELASEPNEH